MLNINRRVKIIAVAVIMLAAAFIGFDMLRPARKAAAVWASANSATQEMNWYFKPREDGLQPEDTPEAQVLRKYGGYNLGSPDEKAIYITFDMGFENGQTPQILDALKKHNAPAAFFVVKHYIDSEPELTKRIVDEGHLICNHSTNHKNMARMTDIEQFKQELTGIEQAYEQLIGSPMPKYHRPPEGTFSEQSLQYTQQLGYTTVMWSFAYKDWEVDNQPSRDEALGKILPRTHNGEIALLHATSQTNADILDEVLTEWENQGYVFKSLDELPQQPGQQPAPSQQ